MIKLKKITASVLALVICVFCFTSCDTLDKLNAIKDSKNQTTLAPTTTTTVPVYTEIQNDTHHVLTTSYYYNELSESSKVAYINIANAIREHKESVKIDFYISEEEVSKIYTAICYDNPTLICITGTYGYEIDEKSVIIEPEYSLSFEECFEKSEELNESVKKAISLIDKNGSDYEKELALHDWLILNCSNNEVQEKKKNAYDALVLGEADSYGYSRAMQLLLNNVGIKNHLVVGLYQGVKEVEHMWNVVEIDGENYHLDVSLNDPIKVTKELLKHFYFNVTDDFINEDHFEYKPENNNCSANNSNYYVMENLVFSEYNNQTKAFIKDEITRIANNHQYYVEICFDNDYAYIEGKKSMVDYNGVYKIIKEVNHGLSDENKLSLDMLYWEYNEKYRVIRFELTYVNEMQEQ